MRNSTIINKKKQLKCGHFDYNFSRGRCKQCATIEDTNKRVVEHEEKESDESVQNLIQDLDAIFSKFIRNKYADQNGIVQCFTCPTKLPIAQIQNGHFVHRTDMATRFLEANCRPQCPACNSKHNDDKSIFASRLEAETHGIVAWLEEQAREVVKPTREELRAAIADYRWKTKLLEKKLKTKT